MTPSSWFARFALLAAAGGLAATAPAQPDVPAKGTPTPLKKGDAERNELTGIRRTLELYVHDASKTAFRKPREWKVIEPARLKRAIDPRVHTMMGFESNDAREIVVMLYWLPLDPRDSLAAMIRDKLEGGSYGEEHATLASVYGKEKVGVPEVVRVGIYEKLWKIRIDDGPSRDGRYAGLVYLAELGSGDNRWLVKIRATFLKANKEDHEKTVQELLKNYELIG